MRSARAKKKWSCVNNKWNRGEKKAQRTHAHALLYKESSVPLNTTTVRTRAARGGDFVFWSAALCNLCIQTAV